MLRLAWREPERNINMKRSTGTWIWNNSVTSLERKLHTLTCPGVCFSPRLLCERLGLIHHFVAQFSFSLVRLLSCKCRRRRLEEGGDSECTMAFCCCFQCEHTHSVEWNPISSAGGSESDRSRAASGVNWGEVPGSHHLFIRACTALVHIHLLQINQLHLLPNPCVKTFYLKIFIFEFLRFPSTLYANQQCAWKHLDGIPDSWHAKLFIANCGGELFNDVKRSDNFVANQRGPVRLAALSPPASCLKHHCILIFHPSAYYRVEPVKQGSLTRWHQRARRPAAPDDRGTTAAGSDYSPAHEKPLMLLGNSYHRARLHRLLDKPVLVCHRVPTRLLLFVLPSRLTASYYFFPPLVLTFSASRRLCPLALLPRPFHHPSCLSPAAFPSPLPSSRQA